MHMRNFSDETKTINPAIMASSVASGNQQWLFPIKLVFVMNVHYLRTCGKNFIHLQRKICCQQNGLFVCSKSGRPIFSYFMAGACCCLRSITLLFMSCHIFKQVNLAHAYTIFAIAKTRPFSALDVCCLSQKANQKRESHTWRAVDFFWPQVWEM